VTAVASNTPPVQLPPAEMEEWEMRVDGTIMLKVLKPTRFGQVIEDILTIGPNRRGYRFQISADDRKDNQRGVAAVEHDPFKNGMLLRVDADQQADEETKSDDVLSDEAVLEILDLEDSAFQTRVATLGEVPVRQFAVGAGASHSKVSWLNEHIAERFLPGGPQTSIQDGGTAERLS
jgi:hypothetical protein